ncbi:hypothetical protein CAC42_4005 [Sphaceloma murrayae]|uniref:Uncharacterized protein n=1 Tax=Sphaceloma murrayae TaxID=2082308 RepID=A0A2K1QSH5_9PEZI|nr:hypothetical protein CAC42_4005 [Sphaceloma murrayae]
MAGESDDTTDLLTFSPYDGHVPISVVTPYKSTAIGDGTSDFSPLTPFSTYDPDPSPSRKAPKESSFTPEDARRFSTRPRRPVIRLGHELEQPRVPAKSAKRKPSNKPAPAKRPPKRSRIESSSREQRIIRIKIANSNFNTQNGEGSHDSGLQPSSTAPLDCRDDIHGAPQQDTIVVSSELSDPAQLPPDNASITSGLSPVPSPIVDEEQHTSSPIDNDKLDPGPAAKPPSGAGTIPSRPRTASPVTIKIPGPPSLDEALQTMLLCHSKRIMRKTPVAQKPVPRGQPLVWAPNRQTLCETILYFQSWQSACYISKGVLYSFMFDGNGSPRDLIDGDVIIARAGGGMSRDKVTGEMQQNKNQTENHQTQAVRAAIASQNPIVVFCGSENTDVPSRMPHRYQVLGWFKPTHVWAERGETHGKIWTNFKYRFEKLQTGEESWWLPQGEQHPDQVSGALAHPETSSNATSTVDRLVQGSPTPGHDTLVVTDIQEQRLKEDVQQQQEPAEESDKRTEDTQVFPYGEDGSVDAFPIVKDITQNPNADDMVHSANKEDLLNSKRKDSAMDASEWTTNKLPSIGDFDPPTTFTCSSCATPSEQVYLCGWMCLHSTCPNFWLLSSGNIPSEASLVYDPRFLKQCTPWTSETPPYSLRPALPSPSSRLGESVSFAMTRGMCCPDCGKCSSRSKWAGWFCECGFSHTPPHPVIPRTLVRDPWHPVSNLYAQCHDWADANLNTTVRFSHNYRVVTYEIPGLQGCSINHLVANRTVNEEPKGPDDMFETLQQVDCGLERRRFVTGKEEFMTAFSNNRGMPYKFVAKGESASFEGAPWPLTETRSRLNWASRLVLGQEKFGREEEFNELLTIGYFDGQNIKYHDDGEKGLGATVASLSLGYPADMWFRVKGKHWTGMTKGGQFVNTRPLPGTLEHEARTKAFEELNAAGTVNPARLREVAGDLDLQDNLRDRKPWLRLRLSHGDVVVMHGRQVQEYFEHQVDPLGTLRFALTCRTILPEHLQKDEMPEYEVLPDNGHYDGSGIVDLKSQSPSVVIFPSTYRSDAAQPDTKVDEQVNLSTQRPGREGHESRYESSAAYRKGQSGKTTRYEVDIEEERRRPGRREEDIRIYTEDRRAPRETRIEIEETREPRSRHIDAHIEVDRRSNPIDRLEHDYRARTVPLAGDWEDQSSPRSHIDIHTTQTTQNDHKRDDMGYYDEDGHYHSFRHGVARAADRILHPIHGGSHHHHHRHHDREEIVVEERDVTAPRRTEIRESVRYVDRGVPPNTVTIPCHHIRIGDLVMLQGRPCQVIRVSTSQHTGQHRYLGVDLFTKQLHEESSFVSHPSPSVVVQNMLGPVFKQYRILDIGRDGRIVAMTETGDVKQALPVLDQSGLLNRIEDSFNNGRGSVRVLVINDEGRELVVDYKIVHGSRL